MKQSRKQLNIYLPKDIIFWGCFFFHSNLTGFNSFLLHAFSTLSTFLMESVGSPQREAAGVHHWPCSSDSAQRLYKHILLHRHELENTPQALHPTLDPSGNSSQLSHIQPDPWRRPLWKFISIITYPARPLSPLGQCEQLRYNLNTKRQFRNADHRSRGLPTVPGTSLWILS